MTKTVPLVGDKARPVKEARAFGDQITDQQDGTQAGGAAPRERGINVKAGWRMKPRISEPVKFSTVYIV